MARIFISYSRVDESFARRLAASLSDLGADVWIDVEDIPAGMKWSSAIQQGLRQCEAMIVILSPNSVGSSNVEDEWQDFLDNRKPVIPVLYRAVSPADVHFQLRRIQYIDFHGQQYGLALQQLHAELARKGAVLDPIAELQQTGQQDSTDSPATQDTATPRQPRYWVLGAAVAAAAVLVIGAVVLASLNRGGAQGTPGQTEQNLSTLTSVAGVDTLPPASDTPAATVGSTSTNTPTLDIVYIVATMDAQSTAAVRATNIALDTQSAVDATLTATSWTATPTPTHTLTPNLTASIDAFTTARAETATAQFLIDQRATEDAYTDTPTITPRPSNTPVPPPHEKVVITWFVGVGSGSSQDQVDVENRVVKAFNDAHNDIELRLVVENDFSKARDTLLTQIAAGTAPDIIGPIGDDAANTFAQFWLDLQPLVEQTGYDLNQFPKRLVDFFRDSQGQTALPFAVYPSFIFYNRNMFDKAGLEHPPSRYGDLYGSTTWDYQALSDVATVLTVDKNGNNAFSSRFDPNNIEQWGFNQQWSFGVDEFAFFGAGDFYDRGTGQAVIPDNWRAEANWYYDAIWDKHIAPTNPQETDLNGNAFASGRIAMARTHAWYTCCLTDLQASWDIAPMPSYNGQYTSTLDTDTFRILNTTRYPDAAFEVLTYLIGDASADLLTAYGAFPARESQRDAYFDTMKSRYPQNQNVNWQVVSDSLNYATLAPARPWMPNGTAASDRINAFLTLVHSNSGLNVDAELESLRRDLQDIFNQAK
jgi:multiple sugar transport system substrate-binding protein